MDLLKVLYHQSRLVHSLSPGLLLLPTQRNGVIINYSITCTFGEIMNITKQPNTNLSISVEPFTNYSCTVSAATVVGNGPATVAISGVTDEDSMCSLSYTYSVLYIFCRTWSTL